MTTHATCFISLLFLITCMQLSTLHASEQEAAQPGPFTPDHNTLFLAHFDDDHTQADYALGNPLFAGNGASLTEGYFGRAIDLRARGLKPDFMNTCDDATPRYDGWGFHARGNVNVAQGTFECFFKPADAADKKLLWSTNFLNAELARPVFNEETGRYIGFGLTLNHVAMRYFIPTVAGNLHKGDLAYSRIDGFNRSLSPDQWHHFAMTWSQGELVMYIDGRPLLSIDMTDELGLVLLDNPTRYLSMSDCIIDELRISNVVRYSDSFEPAWRDGQRPDYAFTGNPAVERFDPKLIDMPHPQVVTSLPESPDTQAVSIDDVTISFDRATGNVIGMNVAGREAAPSVNGLMLHQGLERKPLATVSVSAWRNRDGVTRFDQIFEGSIVAAHEITKAGNSVQWRITLTNNGNEEAWLEPLLSLPVPIAHVSEMFDNVAPRKVLNVARHRDEYCYALPFAAASGDGEYFGLGIEPTTDLSDIVSQWAPLESAGVLRQGTKVALSPGESFTLPYRIVKGEGDFETLDAIAAYHSLFPDLYSLLPDVPVYTYMPMTQYAYASPYYDIKRLGYVGNFWGHGPGHDKGDEYGNPDWWDNPELVGRKEYEYTQRIEKLWLSIDILRKNIEMYYRQSYDNYYPVRRFHTCPDVTPKYIVELTWPGYKPNADTLCFGQYYEPIMSWWIVNEYNTPIGEWFRTSGMNYLLQSKMYTNGFINDMSHAGSLYRHNDPIAQQTTGRSFSRDLGTFVRKALGRKQRYETVNNTVINGQRMTFWSDGGSFSYTLGAYSAGMAIEGAGMYKDLIGSGRYIVPARNLVGEKPFSSMTHENDDWIGYYLNPEDFTPQTLRDYYRYNGAHLVLHSLKHGMTLDSGSYMFGRQFELEMSPLMVEAATLGRKIVHGATVDEPLWVRRNGDNLGSLLIAGNQSPKPQPGMLTVYNRYYDAAPLFVNYFSGGASHVISEATTLVDGGSIAAREPLALKAAALLDAADGATATTDLAGDGLAMTLSIRLNLPASSHMMLHDFGKMYELSQVTLDGKPFAWRQGQYNELPAGEHTLIAQYQNRAFAFSPQQWAEVELIRDGKTSFELLADAGEMFRVDPEHSQVFKLGFERGTAEMYNEFLTFYDQEDGRLGNLAPAPILSEPSDNDDVWTIAFKREPMISSGRIRIDSDEKLIVVEGKTQGEIRRASVVLLRLVDRKYPHVGRFHPLDYRKKKYDADKPVPFDKWIVRAQTREFFQNFEDQKFWVKPILRANHEALYADDNMQFTGRYSMMTPPFIVEPTYEDDFVYGYEGPGDAPSVEKMYKRIGMAAK